MMGTQIRVLPKRFTLAQRFMLASLIILVAGMFGVGAWVVQQIETGVIRETAATTALYVDSFVAQDIQELATSSTLKPEHVADLNRLLQETPLGQQIVAFKVWDVKGQIIYSSEPDSIGQVFPVQGGLASAWNGHVSSKISDLGQDENALERAHEVQLLETYSPVRLEGSNRIIAVAEFYKTIDELEQQIAVAQMQSWVVVGVTMLVMYLLLAGFVQRASDTIERQQVELSDKVARLTSLLAQNKELHERVRSAAAATTAINERFLRRVSAEFHDGPAQDLGLALFHLDNVIANAEACRATGCTARQDGDDLALIKSSLSHALQEVRAISTGMGLPQLNHLTIAETVARVVRGHEHRTSTEVAVQQDTLPLQAPLSVKITLYRLIQEALTNAYRHAGGVAQQVCVRCANSQLHVEISDAGPGFDAARSVDWNDHLGLVGMRERVESLGGIFRVESQIGKGTAVIAELPLQAKEETPQL